MSDIILESTITCPECGHKKTETMSTDACQYYYECESCNSLLKPNQGDYCVFCSLMPLRGTRGDDRGNEGTGWVYR